MEIIHETKNATPLVNGSAATCGTARHQAAILPHHAVLNEAPLDFSGIGHGATNGTAGSVNVSVEITGFDFSGTVRYRTVSECYFTRVITEQVRNARAQRHVSSALYDHFSCITKFEDLERP
jgi:hypothetical protein